MSPRNHVSAGSEPFPSQAPIVFVIDNDISVHASLEALICTAGWRSQMFTSAEEFLASRPMTGEPSCVMSEVILPGLSGLELQSRLVGQHNIPMMFLTSHRNVSVTVRAMKAGAVEFLMKPFREETLMHALRSALERSQIALRREVELRTLRERYATLSEREREVMALVVSGLMNKHVGHQLRITEITVKVHRGRVMRKMEADSLPALVVMAATLGLPSPEARYQFESLGRDPRRAFGDCMPVAPAVS